MSTAAVTQQHEFSSYAQDETSEQKTQASLTVCHFISYRETGYCSSSSLRNVPIHNHCHIGPQISYYRPTPAAAKKMRCHTCERLFLANVNVRYMLSPDRRLSSVCLSSATLCGRLKFSAIFLWHFVPWPSFDIHRKFYGDRPRGIPPSEELNTQEG